MEHLFSVCPGPVTTTSANPTGKKGAGDAEKILSYFPQGIDCILDAGPVPGGVGSTVVDVTGERPEILREGTLSARDIAEALEGR
jgi:L-threonylcarbamoyladenylate synthase